MSKVYQVLAAKDFPFNIARVGGRAFTHGEPVLIHESNMTDEILHSSALEVTLLPEEVAVTAETEPTTPPETTEGGDTPSAPDGETATGFTLVGEGFRLHADGKAEFDSLTIPRTVQAGQITADPGEITGWDLSNTTQTPGMPEGTVEEPAETPDEAPAPAPAASGGNRRSGKNKSAKED